MPPVFRRSTACTFTGSTSAAYRCIAAAPCSSERPTENGPRRRPWPAYFRRGCHENRATKFTQLTTVLPPYCEGCLKRIARVLADPPHRPAETSEGDDSHAPSSRNRSTAPTSSRLQNTGKYTERPEYRPPIRNGTVTNFVAKGSEFRGRAANWVGVAPVFAARYWFQSPLLPPLRRLADGHAVRRHLSRSDGGARADRCRIDPDAPKGATPLPRSQA